MKQITDIATVVKNNVDEFNRIIADYVNKYQREGKEVDVQFGVSDKNAGAMVIAYIEKADNADNKESGNIEEQ